MTKVKDLSDEVLSSLTETEKDFLLSWKTLYEDKEFQDKLEKILKPVKKTIYDLKKGDEYSSITLNGGVNIARYDNDFVDNLRLSIGNVFLTEEDAEFEIEYLKVKAELKRYASMCKKPIDWNNSDQAKYTLVYEHLYKCLQINTKYTYNHGSIFFTNKEVLSLAIKEIGEERIKKYYLGVRGEN